MEAMMDAVYLDNNASTLCDARVVAAMADCYARTYGNPSSNHRLGRAARQALATAAEQVAALLGCEPGELVFTSGATESIHLAVRGVLAQARRRGRRGLVVSAVEHGAVRELVEPLRAGGCEVTVVPVDRDGVLDLDALRQAVTDRTALVSLVHANSDTGVVTDVSAAAAVAAQAQVPLHVDATQSVGKLPIDLAELPGVSLLSLSAHKFHGPMGVGALFVRRGVRLLPQIPGPQQLRRRGGTENVPGIVGLGVAAGIAAAELPEVILHCAALRDQLLEGILRRVKIAVPHGLHAPRLCNTLSLGLADLDGAEIVEALSRRGVCASTGSACRSDRRQISPTLAAMGVPPGLARGTIRLSLSRFTRAQEIDRVLEALPEVVGELSTPRSRRCVLSVP